MNIRNYVHKTYVPSHKVEINIQRPVYKTSFWGNRIVDRYEWKKEMTHVDSKWVEETRLQYLNPETLKWEDLPRVTEEQVIEHAQMKGLTGSYHYAT